MRGIPTFKIRPKRPSKKLARFSTKTCCSETGFKDLPQIYDRLITTLLMQQSAEDAEDETEDEDED